MKKKKDFEIEWSKTVNNPSLKPWKDNYGTKHKILTAKHYMAYNIIRNKPLERGFSYDSDIFKKAINGIELAVKFNREDMIKNLFGDSVPFNEFTEKANEAIRIYRSS